MKRKDLIKAATEMNTIMGLKPPIDVKLGDLDLQKSIIESTADITKDDEFSAETTAVLKTLLPEQLPEELPAEDEEAEVEVAVPVAPAKPTRSAPAAKPAAPAAPVKAKTLPEIVQSTAKLSELKDLVNVNDAFKKLRGKALEAYTGLTGPKELKLAMYKVLGVEPPVAGTIADTRVIRLVVEKNPKREGSESATRFALYKTGMTVADFLKAGGRAGDVAWDVKHKFITLA